MMAAQRAASFAGGHAAKIMSALQSLGTGTQSTIAEATGLLPHQVNKRLADLCREGQIELTGRTAPNELGNHEREWRTI